MERVRVVATSWWKVLTITIRALAAVELSLEPVGLVPPFLQTPSKSTASSTAFLRQNLLRLAGLRLTRCSRAVRINGTVLFLNTTEFKRWQRTVFSRTCRMRKIL